MTYYLYTNGTTNGQKQPDWSTADKLARQMMAIPTEGNIVNVTVEIRQPATKGSAAEEVVASARYSRTNGGEVDYQIESRKHEEYLAIFFHIRHLFEAYRSGDSTERNARFNSLHYHDAVRHAQLLEEALTAPIRAYTWEVLHNAAEQCREAIRAGLRANGINPDEEDTWLATGKLERKGASV